MQRPVAPTQRDHSELMAAKINRAQQIQRRTQAARRRLTLLTVQFAVAIVLVAAAAVTSFSWLWTLIPVATMGATLFLGARAAQAGRENDQRALERIRALETRPAKGHRMSESEKKYAQLSAKAETDAKSQVDVAAKTESDSVKSAEQPAKVETSTADTAEVVTKQQANESQDQSTLGKLAAAARRAANFREYFVRGEDESADKVADEASEVVYETKLASKDDNTENIADIAAPTVATSEETEVKESPVVAPVAVESNTEIEAADTAEIVVAKSQAEPVESAAVSEKESLAEERGWTPTPMPKPIYALKPRLARRDVDASELLAEHLATRGSAPYRPSRPHPHTEESLTTAQLVAQSKPVDVEAILNTRRIAN